MKLDDLASCQRTRRMTMRVEELRDKLTEIVDNGGGEMTVTSCPRWPWDVENHVCIYPEIDVMEILL